MSSTELVIDELTHDWEELRERWKIVVTPSGKEQRERRMISPAELETDTWARYGFDDIDSYYADGYGNSRVVGVWHGCDNRCYLQGTRRDSNPGDQLAWNARNANGSWTKRRSGATTATQESSAAWNTNAPQKSQANTCATGSQST